jgi:hypothetical protein
MNEFVILLVVVLVGILIYMLFSSQSSSDGKFTYNDLTLEQKRAVKRQWIGSIVVGVSVVAILGLIFWVTKIAINQLILMLTIMVLMILVNLYLGFCAVWDQVSIIPGSDGICGCGNEGNEA